MNNALREMRAADPQKARAVDAAIRRIPHSEGIQVRIDVPGAPPGREYRAIVPDGRDAPAVIYRSLGPDDGADGEWLVTTLIDRDEYVNYQQAERRGILDSPAVREMIASVAGTVSSIVVTAPPGTVGRG